MLFLKFCRVAKRSSHFFINIFPTGSNFILFSYCYCFFFPYLVLTQKANRFPIEYNVLNKCCIKTTEKQISLFFTSSATKILLFFIKFQWMTDFFLMDFLSKCEQICMRIWSYLLKKSSKENFIFCVISFMKAFSKSHDLFIWLVSRRYFSGLH